MEDGERKGKLRKVHVGNREWAESSASQSKLLGIFVSKVGS